MNFYRFQSHPEFSWSYHDTLASVMKECRAVPKDARDNPRVQLVDMPVAKSNVLRLLNENQKDPEGITVLKRWRLGSTQRSVELVPLKEGEE